MAPGFFLTLETCLTFVIRSWSRSELHHHVAAACLGWIQGESPHQWVIRGGAHLWPDHAERGRLVPFQKWNWKQKKLTSQTSQWHKGNISEAGRQQNREEDHKVGNTLIRFLNSGSLDLFSFQILMQIRGECAEGKLFQVGFSVTGIKLFKITGICKSAVVQFKPYDRLRRAQRDCCVLIHFDTLTAFNSINSLFTKHSNRLINRNAWDIFLCKDTQGITPLWEGQTLESSVRWLSSNNWVLLSSELFEWISFFCSQTLF